MSTNFITGTGTDIGKTWLVCALLRHWQTQGVVGAAYKPVQSGFDPASTQTSDAGIFLATLGRGISDQALDTIAPWRFAAPLSPDMAAAAEGRSIPFDDLVKFTCRAALGNEPRILIEGVGGVMVPLDARHTVRDWIAASGLSAVLVAGSYLGSLSHTLTALSALQQAQVTIAAIAVNESVNSSVTLAATVATLNNHVGAIPVIAIQRDTPGEGIAQLATLLN